MKAEQSSLFSQVEASEPKPAVAKSARPRSKPESPMPPGFRYQENFLTESEEQTVADELAKLPFKPFDFHGYQGNRRVVSFGLRYDYDRRAVEVAAPPPQFLEDLRARAAAFAGHSTDDIRQVGINEYRPGAGIGWHRDKSQFGDVIGVSLLSPVKMR